MNRRTPRSGILSCCLVAVVAAFAGHVVAAELPQATQAALKQVNLEPSVMDGLDEELNVPQEWLDRAKGQGAAKVLGTWDPQQFQKMEPVFRARYPGVKISYARSSRYDRAITTLMAMQDGRYVADVIVSFNRSYSEFVKADALADLRSLPAFKNLADDMRGEEGLWVGSKITRRCIGYNTDRIKDVKELPQQWDEFLTHPRWRDGRLAVINSYTVWLLPLWQAKGEAWATNFLTRLKNEVKPQLRKEGENAALGLVAAGEYDAIIVAAEYRSKERQKKGAPIGFHCPTPVPVAVSPMAVLRGSPNQDAAMIFVNWAISREGQLLSFAGSGQAPTHKAFQRPEFEYFPDTIHGKESAYADALGDVQDKVQKLWVDTWGQTK
ncbi:MAG: ABC transporter substrate-binding protein [Gemmatimonas sp.]